MLTDVLYKLDLNSPLGNFQDIVVLKGLNMYAISEDWGHQPKETTLL